MALPLIAALGAGILGGGRYLMNKADERAAENTRAGLQSFLANSSLPQATQFGLLNRMQLDQQNSAGGLAGFLDTGENRRAQSMLDYAMQADAQNRQAQAQMTRASQERLTDRGFQLSDQLDQDYNRDLRLFGTVIQPAFRKALNALENPNSADTVSSLYNFFNLIEPGGRVTENEDGSFQAIGGMPSRFANWLNQIRGKGLDDPTRRQIIDAVWKQYQPELQAAKARKAKYERDIADLRGRGYQIQSPIGRLGIDFGLNQIPEWVGGGGAATQSQIPQNLQEQGWRPAGG